MSVSSSTSILLGPQYSTVLEEASNFSEFQKLQFQPLDLAKNPHNLVVSIIMKIKAGFLWFLDENWSQFLLLTSLTLCQLQAQDVPNIHITFSSYAYYPVHPKYIILATTPPHLSPPQTGKCRALSCKRAPISLHHLDYSAYLFQFWQLFKLLLDPHKKQIYKGFILGCQFVKPLGVKLRKANKWQCHPNLSQPREINLLSPCTHPPPFIACLKF